MGHRVLCNVYYFRPSANFHDNFKLATATGQRMSSINLCRFNEPRLLVPVDTPVLVEKLELLECYRDLRVGWAAFLAVSRLTGLNRLAAAPQHELSKPQCLHFRSVERVGIRRHNQLHGVGTSSFDNLKNTAASNLGKRVGFLKVVGPTQNAPRQEVVSDHLLSARTRTQPSMQGACRPLTFGREHPLAFSCPCAPWRCISTAVHHCRRHR